MTTGRSEDVLNRLRDLKPAFKGLGIKRVRVFGSVARGEARIDSDLDLIVDFFETPGLFEFAGVQMELEEKLGMKVDLVTQKGLHPALRNRILEEARDV